jgi:hypothetical protein
MKMPEGPAMRLISFFAAAVMILTAQSHVVAAQDARIERLRMLESGFYTGEKTGEVSAPGSVAGHVNELSNLKFLEDPPATTAKVGTAFGVRFRAIGDDDGANVTLRSVWKIPAPGIHNPSNDNTYRQSVTEFKVAIGGVITRGYTFDEPWEVVRGVWTLEIWQADRKLLERDFTIK